MSANTRRLLAWLPMVGVAALAIRTALVWDRLPAVMWSHFDINGNPDGRMPREALVMVSFAVVVSMVLIFALIADQVGRRKPGVGFVMLAFAYVCDAFIITLFWNVLTSNLEHVPLRVFPIWLLLAVLIPILVAVSVDWKWWLSKSRREAARQVRSAQVITEQRHGSETFAAIFVLFALGLIVLVLALTAKGRPAFVLPLLGTIIAAVLISAVWAWQGFVYRFTTQGVEIRALGFRLCSIPISEIKDFRSERCNPLTDFGGWGVKGFGTDTAYIWSGRKVLHIRTSHGDVYLGHNDPDRLVRDLEAIMNPAH